MTQWVPSQAKSRHHGWTLEQDLQNKSKLNLVHSIQAWSTSQNIQPEPIERIRHGQSWNKSSWSSTYLEIFMENVKESPISQVLPIGNDRNKGQLTLEYCRSIWSKPEQFQWSLTDSTNPMECCNWPPISQISSLKTEGIKDNEYWNIVNWDNNMIKPEARCKEISRIRDSVNAMENWQVHAESEKHELLQLFPISQHQPRNDGWSKGQWTLED